ncbi:MAG: ATP-binding cassette domain-containing protein, partial [Spirochaetota bacterium]
MENEACIELRSVTLEAKGSPILDRVDLGLGQGTRAMVMGGAGSGKSSLLKVSAGILIPDSGEVFIEGRPLSDLSRHDTLAFHRRCGFVFQDAALWSNQSLYENIAFPVRFHTPSVGAAQLDAAVRGAAELAGYSRSLSLRPAEVSGGERRLIGLARALVLDPDILFLDEPTVSLDEEETTR